jgi:hypothetical protein
MFDNFYDRTEDCCNTGFLNEYGDFSLISYDL